MKSDYEKYIKNHLNYKGLKGDHIINDTYDMIVKNSITPNIIEERQLNVSILDIFSRLMMDRIIWLNGEVNDRMSTVTQAQLLFLGGSAHTDVKKDIIMHIDTPGGSVKSGLSMVDSMRTAIPDICTINTGMAASMGSVLLSSGTPGKRSSLIHSKMMIHQVSAGARGHVNDMTISMSETIKYNYILMKMLAKNSNQSFEELLEAHERDIWYNSDEMLKHGFIDEVIIPEGEESITQLMKGFDKYKKRMSKKYGY